MRSSLKFVQKFGDNYACSSFLSLLSVDTTLVSEVEADEQQSVDSNIPCVIKTLVIEGVRMNKKEIELKLHLYCSRSILIGEAHSHVTIATR